MSYIMESILKGMMHGSYAFFIVFILYKSLHETNLLKPQVFKKMLVIIIPLLGTGIVGCINFSVIGVDSILKYDDAQYTFANYTNGVYAFSAHNPVEPLVLCFPSDAVLFFNAIVAIISITTLDTIILIAIGIIRDSDKLAKKKHNTLNRVNQINFAFNILITIACCFAYFTAIRGPIFFLSYFMALFSNILIMYSSYKIGGKLPPSQRLLNRFLSATFYMKLADLIDSSIYTSKGFFVGLINNIPYSKCSLVFYPILNKTGVYILNLIEVFTLPLKAIATMYFVYSMSKLWTKEKEEASVPPSLHKLINTPTNNNTRNLSSVNMNVARASSTGSGASVGSNDTGKKSNPTEKSEA